LFQLNYYIIFKEEEEEEQEEEEERQKGEESKEAEARPDCARALKAVSRRALRLCGCVLSAPLNTLHRRIGHMHTQGDYVVSCKICTCTNKS
jgi:hypothetical protein